MQSDATRDFFTNACPSNVTHTFANELSNRYRCSFDTQVKKMCCSETLQGQPMYSANVHSAHEYAVDALHGCAHDQMEILIAAGNGR